MLTLCILFLKQDKFSVLLVYLALKGKSLTDFVIMYLCTNLLSCLAGWFSKTIKYSTLLLIRISQISYLCPVFLQRLRWLYIEKASHLYSTEMSVSCINLIDLMYLHFPNFVNFFNEQWQMRSCSTPHHYKKKACIAHCLLLADLSSCWPLLKMIYWTTVGALRECVTFGTLG